MVFKQILAAVLAIMLAISPAMAAYCSASCAQLASPATSVAAYEMDGMEDCHEDHTPSPENAGVVYENCDMAGCHTAVSAMILEAGPDQYAFDPDTLQPRFNPKSSSADLPPPVKPPA